MFVGGRRNQELFNSYQKIEYEWSQKEAKNSGIKKYTYEVIFATLLNAIREAIENIGEKKRRKSQFFEHSLP